MTLHTPAITPPHQRAIGSGTISVKADQSGVTKLADLYQKANAKIRIPKVHGTHLEAVLINTSGGMTGGDSLDWAINVGKGSSIVVTTQACEKVYRAAESSARVETKITVSAHAHMEWLPQETILFDHGSLKRSLSVDLDDTADFLAIEAVVLGREAMGETLANAALVDRWHIRRGGTLLHADTLRMDGELAAFALSAAVLDGASAFATLVWSPANIGDEELKAKRDVLRTIVEAAPVQAGFSALPNRLVGRVCARGLFALRQGIVPVLKALTASGTVPKVWSL